MKHLRGIRIFLLVFFLSGALGLALDITRPYFIKVIPLSLVLSYVFLILFHRKDQRLSTLSVLGGIGLAGFLVEMAGVMTGHIFGTYVYGKVLGPSLAGVPLLIGMNWMMLAYATHLIMKDFRLPSWLGVMGGALLMTAYDWLMEPAAVDLGMWAWAGGIIPLQNYLAWFVLSALFLMLLKLVKARYENALARDIFLIQAAFFASYQIFSLLLR